MAGLNANRLLEFTYAECGVIYCGEDGCFVGSGDDLGRLNGGAAARTDSKAIAEANASGCVCSAAGCVGCCAIVLLLRGGVGLARALGAHTYAACVTSSTTILQVDSSEWT